MSKLLKYRPGDINERLNTSMRIGVDLYLNSKTPTS